MQKNVVTKTFSTRRSSKGVVKRNVKKNKMNGELRVICNYSLVML